MSKAKERRAAAIRDVVNKFLNKETDYEPRPNVTREQVAADIETLRPLDQTDRWDKALDVWRSWVLDANANLRWAILQGSIGADQALITNTKSQGRRMARELLRDGMSVESLRATATNFQLNADIYRNRHRIAGFAEEVGRLTCWNDVVAIY